MAWHEQGIFLEGKADIFSFKILSVGGFDDELPIRIGRSVDGDSGVVELDAETIYTTSKVTFKLSSTFLPIKTDNNLDAYYYSEETYEEAKKVESAAVAVSATSLTSGFFCLVLKGSLPLVMSVSSLQLVFFSLATIDGMHPAA